MAQSPSFPKYSHNLSLFLADLRSLLFSSQSKCAQYFALSHSTISRYESEQINVKPPVGYIAALAKLIIEKLALSTEVVQQQQELLIEVNRVMRRCYSEQHPWQNWQALSAAAEAYKAARQKGRSRRRSSSSKKQKASKAVTAAPFQAPPKLVDFTGRQAELKALKKALRHNKKPLCLIGMGGVGKTSLAIHLAYQLRRKFPDGVLWAQLERSDTMSVLRAIASAYQVDVSQYTDLGSRSSKVRELLAGKRALMVLDNAERDEDLRALLPPTGSCAVIITTRHHHLSVADHSYRFHIKPFSREKEESLALWTQILGPEWTQRESSVLKEIAELLGQLPLAIAIAAHRMKYEPGWTAAAFLTRVQQQQKRLATLARGEQGVRLSFDLSYHALSPDLQPFFSTLALFDGEDFSLAAAAYVAALETSPDNGSDAEDKLRHLYSLSLVQAGRMGRYKLHPLLRDYSREQISQAEPFERMVTFFVDYIEKHKGDYAALDLEIDNLFAALEMAFERGMKSFLVRGAIASYDFWQARGLYQQAKTHLSRAEQAAREMDDLVSLVAILRHLGRIANKQAHYNQAQALFEEALTLAQQVANLAPTKEGKAQISALLTSLGALAHRRADNLQAKAYYDQAITLAKETGDQPRLVALQTNLGLLTAEEGKEQEAEAIYLKALQLARQLDNHKRATTILLQNLGGLMHDRGHYQQAQRHFQEGLALANQIGDPELRSRLLANLGLVTYASQEYAAADNLFKQALTLAQENQLPLQISRQLANLGLVATAQKDYEQANQHYQAALTLARQSGFPKNICRILNRWGDCQLAQENPTQADAHFREALELARNANLQPEIAESLSGLTSVLSRSQTASL